jgi:chorismate synthase
MNSFGRIFRITIFGESHGACIGVIIDGAPPGTALNKDDFISDIIRRKTGAAGTSKRIESDIPEIVSGWFNGYTTGAPLTIVFQNTNVNSDDYDKTKNIPRPGHVDFAADKKFNGYNDYRGSGHFSGRLTLALVAAGVIAKKIIDSVNIKSEIISVNENKNIDAAIAAAIEKKDSVGGIVECRATGLPIGRGEPFFDSVESVISHLVFAIPGIKGIEFGAGFASAAMYGSQHNDIIKNQDGKTVTNNSGGISGGITNGNELVFRVAVKPVSSIGRTQKSYNFKTNQIEEFEIAGRHDVSIVLRIPVIIEAVTAIALTDFALCSQK